MKQFIQKTGGRQGTPNFNFTNDTQCTKTYKNKSSAMLKKENILVVVTTDKPQLILE
jgi:hypothetical protein